MPTIPSLRDRKKDETRRKIATVTLRLAKTQGWSDLTIDDIAHEADISPRTFFNYFASKAEAILLGHRIRSEQHLAVVAALPSDQPTWTALGDLVRELTRSVERPDPRWIDELTLALADQHIRAQMMLQRRDEELALADILSHRADLEERPAFEARLMAIMYIGAVRTVLETWLRDPTGPTLSELVEQALSRISWLP